MSMYMENDLTPLKKKILSLSALAEEAVYDSVRAFNFRDRDLAGQIIEKDREIDRLEVDVEEDCIKQFNTQQLSPEALRYVVVVLKINNNLERVGDLAANIAMRAIEFSEHPHTPIIFDFTAMAEYVKDMLRQCLDALINSDSKQAYEVRKADDEVDRLHRDVYRIVAQAIENDPAKTHIFLQYISISRYFERIGDLATNIAEDIIYLVEGRITRHQRSS
ncbi:MAG: phosphate signaling complex protein PhoU [Caldithrix sp.]|nr:phosphate signaling complex protein PhoU [Caldithrix sp.]